MDISLYGLPINGLFLYDKIIENNPGYIINDNVKFFIQEYNKSSVYICINDTNPSEFIGSIFDNNGILIHKFIDSYTSIGCFTRKSGSITTTYEYGTVTNYRQTKELSVLVGD